MPKRRTMRRKLAVSLMFVSMLLTGCARLAPFKTADATAAPRFDRAKDAWSLGDFDLPFKRAQGRGAGFNDKARDIERNLGI